MPSLDFCIDGMFTPGNIGASSGEPPPEGTVGSILDPDDPNYVNNVATWSLDQSKFYNSFYMGVY